MNRSYLQGVPWHEEKMKRTCNEGSKYCLYNKNICTCKVSRYFHKKCVGKGSCDEFETKGNTAKVLTSKTYYRGKAKIMEEPKIYQENIEEQNTNESPEEKFKRLSKIRVDNTVENLRKLSNLSNKANYFYTDEDVEKIFSHIQKALDKAKKSFKQEEFMEEFRW